MAPTVDINTLEAPRAPRAEVNFMMRSATAGERGRRRSRRERAQRQAPGLDALVHAAVYCQVVDVVESERQDLRGGKRPRGKVENRKTGGLKVAKVRGGEGERAWLEMWKGSGGPAGVNATQEKIPDGGRGRISCRAAKPASRKQPRRVVLGSWLRR
jgi:hypothetical protein